MDNPVEKAVKQALKSGGKEGEKPPKLRAREITLRRGHKGGYIARHRMETESGEAYGQEHEYPMITMDDLVKHIHEHLGEEKQEIAAEKKGKPGEPQA